MRPVSPIRTIGILQPPGAERLGLTLDIEFTADGPALRANRGAAVSLNFLRTGPGWHYAIPVAGNFVYSVSPCTWKGGKAAAITLFYDDGYLTSYGQLAELASYGLLASWAVIGCSISESPPGDKIGISQIEALYAAGHEIACHALNSWCDFYDRIPDPYPDHDAYAAAEYGGWYTLALAEFTIPEEELRFTLAYPCGSRNTDLDAAAASYVKSVRGYNETDEETYPGRLVGLNPPTPPHPDGVMLVSVYSSDAGDGLGTPQEFALRATYEGKWAVFVSHSTYSSAVLSYIAGLDAWIAPQGRVIEYITMRDALSISGLDVQANGLARTVSFTLSDSLDDDYYNDELTIKVALDAGDVVNSVAVDGSPVSFEYKTIDDQPYVLFDVSPVGSPGVIVNITAVAALPTGEEPELTNLIQEQAENVACYDPCGGIWVRPETPNKGINTVTPKHTDGEVWTASDITAAEGSGDDVLIFGDTSVKLTSTAANGTYTADSAALTADAYYVAGFPVVVVDQDIDVSRVAELIKPTVVQSAAECCLGRVRARFIGRWFRDGHTYRAYDVWDVVLATASAAATIGYKMPTAGVIVYPDAITIYPVGAAGIFEWLGPIPVADDTPITRGKETVQLVCATPTDLLPIHTNRPWAIVVEAAWFLHAALDWATYQDLLPGTCLRDLIAWSKADAGCLYQRYTTTVYQTAYQLRAVAEGGCTYTHTPDFTPGIPQWFFLTCEPAVKPRLWAGYENFASGFIGVPDDIHDTAQAEDCLQFPDGFMVGCDAGGNNFIGVGSNQVAGLIKRILLYDKRKA